MKKYTLAMLSLILGASSVSAQTLSDALRNCGQEQNSLKRLVCYDKIVNDMSSYQGMDELMNIPAPLPARNSAGMPTDTPKGTARSASPAPRAAQAEATAPSTPVSDFGLEHKNLYEDTEKRMYATVAEVTRDKFKKLTITLTDGQVWEQLDSNRLKLSDNDIIYIERGVMNSYLLGTDSVNRRIRVKRVK